MANRRMLAKIVINSGAFLKMPESAQALYVKISLNCDDDGYCDKFFTMNMVRGKEKDLSILVARGFVYNFDDEVLFDLHWLKNNIIRTERKTTSEYIHLQPCHPDVTQMSPKSPHRLGKVRLGKVSNTLSSKNVPFEEILAYLNEKLGKKKGRDFQLTDATKSKITKSWEFAKKHPEYKDDPIKAFLYVIDVKYKEWGNDPEKAVYLRPSTLFQIGKVKNHFEEYLAQDKQSDHDDKKYGGMVGNAKLSFKELDYPFGIDKFIFDSSVQLATYLNRKLSEKERIEFIGRLKRLLKTCKCGQKIIASDKDRTQCNQCFQRQKDRKREEVDKKLKEERFKG